MQNNDKWRVKICFYSNKSFIPAPVLDTTETLKRFQFRENDAI